MRIVKLFVAAAIPFVLLGCPDKPKVDPAAAAAADAAAAPAATAATPAPAASGSAATESGGW